MKRNRKYKQGGIRVDASAGGRLINRYLAEVWFTKYDDNDPENKKIAYSTHGLKIQWANIKTDIVGVFSNPMRFAPQIAYSLAAFAFIILHKYDEARLIAFGGAIAYDATGSATTNSATSLTYAHTVGGSDRVITVGGTGTYGGNASATYAGAAMTSQFGASGGNDFLYKTSPATGANNVVISWSGTAQGASGSISLTGVDTASPIDVSGTSGFGGPGTSATKSVTTTKANSMLVGMFNAHGARTLTSTGAQTQRFSVSSSDRPILGATEPTTATGSYDITGTLSSSESWTVSVVAFNELTSTAWTKELTDTITHTDTILKSITRNLTDTLSLTDVLAASRLFFQTLTETLSLTADIVKSITRNLTDTITHTDTIARSISRVFDETLTITDTVVRLFGRVFSETISFASYLVMNGVLVASNLWSYVSKNVSATYSYVAKNTANWVHRNKS